MDAAHTHEGRCHCGAIAVRLSFTKPADEMQVRACQCSFCTRQGALTVSDPAGSATFEIEASAFSAYKFGTATATSLVCGRCGVYAGVVLAADGRYWSVANARGLAIPAFNERTGIGMYYDEESAAERIARRKQRWTPTVLQFKL